MTALELVVALGASILVCTPLGRRMHVAPALLLLLAGGLLGFAPQLRRVELPPAVVLLLFLPALLYWESITTSLREIRSNLRGIVLVSTLLVIATAGAVALVARQLGVPWGPAWVLGAAVAPTDATAVGEFARSLPHRNIMILRAESLINDGTALVIYSVAVAASVGRAHPSILNIGGRFVFSYAGAAVVGTAVAFIVAPIRRRIDDPLLANVAVLLTPFSAFLIADSIRASGVLAVVTSGLIMSRLGPHVGTAFSRQYTDAFWSLATFLLNATLFVLIGLDSQASARGLTGVDLSKALALVGLVAAVLVAVRLVFLVVCAYIIRMVDRRPQQRLRRVTHRARIVSALAGFRGAVSLAVALSVPTALDSGRPFPDRGVIVFTTFGVIILTLVVQGLILPRVVRWAHLPTDDRLDRERRLGEEVATERALDQLPLEASRMGSDPLVVERVRAEYEKHLRVLRAVGDDDEEAQRYDDDYNALRLALLEHKRDAILRLRHEGRIDDTVLLDLQSRLDIEQVRLSWRG